ncbi:DUF4136 domain-containing protein [Qipengyuania flava]|uniref:DUF4136 domain-containing protein n=1 Tax=Qipengyuania flava TaxID=192812 RepID=UPI001C629A89|nr:DUF4136 domain-containing protein [Qipengyuania flava]QYJ07700.1 DUF4136 domain-containing protein [Qipengyuania flava]
MDIRNLAMGLAAAAALTGCVAPQGPVEVTRFVAAERVSSLGQGNVFVAGAPGDAADSLELAPYKAAVAEELARLGYTETDRDSAGQIAEIAIERFVSGGENARSPVSVGVGGSTGSYGSGLGVGIGINLGGGPKEQVSTRLSVTLRDTASGENLWEGRADLRTPVDSPLARGRANAQTLASALFREFPGNSGETIEVEVSE